MRRLTVFLLLVLGQSALGAVSSISTITVRWTAPGDDGRIGRAAMYDIRYSTSPITDANWNQATQVIGEPRPASAGSQQTCTIYGLTLSRTYYIRLKTIDERGNQSPLSNQVMATTCGGMCDNLVGNVDCSPDENVDLSDLSALVAYLFYYSSPQCICLYEANMDGSPPIGEWPSIDITDMTALIDHLFGTFHPLRSCK